LPLIAAPNALCNVSAIQLLLCLFELYLIAGVFLK